jgi:hypothetical protein
MGKTMLLGLALCEKVHKMLHFHHALWGKLAKFFKQRLFVYFRHASQPLW